MLSGLEAARGNEVRGILQAATRLDKNAAEMDLDCAVAMERKVIDVVINDGLDCLLVSAAAGQGRND